MAGIKPRSLEQKFLGSPPSYFLTKQFIYLFITVFTYEKATLSSYEKNAVYAAFPPHSDRIFKMRKCVSASGN